MKFCILIDAAPGDEPAVEEVKARKSSSDVFQRMKSAANNKLPGQYLHENFISEEEERRLIEYIDTCEPAWHLSTFNGPHGYVFLPV